MLWTDLTGMIIIVPLIITALSVLFIFSFMSLASLTEVRCPLCKHRFLTVSGRDRHMKNEKGEDKKGLLKKAA